MLLLTKPVNITAPQHWFRQSRMLRRYAPQLYIEHKRFLDLISKRQRADCFAALNMAALYRHSAAVGAGECSKEFWIARHREALAAARANDMKVLP